MNYLAGVCGCAEVIVHNNSLANLTRGVVERVLYVVRNGRLGSTPKPQEGVFDRLGQMKEQLVQCLSPTTVYSPLQFALSYSGRKQARYLAAVDSLSKSELVESDSNVNTFVKAEKIVLKPGKEDPAPRVIQPRSYRFNVCVGRYLSLIHI